jgi:hypothetical protein
MHWSFSELDVRESQHFKLMVKQATKKTRESAPIHPNTKSLQLTYIPLNLQF